MADVAERAGISRATLYRDAGLRDLVGNRGDGPAVRPVDGRTAERLERELAELKRERRGLRRELREAVQRVEELITRCNDLERAHRESPSVSPNETISDSVAEAIRREAYAEGFTAGARSAAQRSGMATRGGTTTGIMVAAARLPRASVVQARRTLARALHPDLFANDPAAALLATEILKQLNGIAEK